jgi:hypothetical protein
MKGEPKLRFVGGFWYLIYNDRLIGGKSLPAIQRSADRGVTWADFGPLTYSSLPGVAGVALGDMYLDPNSGKWIALAVTSTSLDSQGGLRNPFTFVIFQSSGDITGPYTQINTIPANPGSWSDSSPGPGGNFWDGTRYNLFASGIEPSGSWPAPFSGVSVVGLWQGTTLSGTFTQPTPSTPMFDVNVNGPNLSSIQTFTAEGVSFAYNQPLNLYICTITVAIWNGGLAYDFLTLIQYSATPTGFSTSGWKYIQWVNPADVAVIMDFPSIVHDAANSHAATGPNGEMTLVMSGQWPNATPVVGNYTALRAHYATIEPASAVLRYTGSADTTLRGLSRSIAHTDITVELASEQTGLHSGGVGSLAIAYRSDGTGNNEYRATLAVSGVWSLIKVVGGTPTTVAAGAGAQVYENHGATLGMLHRLKVQVVGNTHSAWLDGEQQYSFTDSSSPFTSGTTLTAYGKGINGDLINLSCRTSDTITVNGMQPLTSCWLRAACGIPIATIVANGSGVGTISYGHFPLYSLDVAGTDYTVGSDSRIWGGDTLQFSGLPTASPSIPVNFKYT